MHIPDNYLSPATCAVFGGAMAGVLGVAVRKVRAETTASQLPLVGIGAAFSFLVMMFNLPLPGGSTGHAVGAVLVATLVGPWSASLAVSVALLVQALLFGDGGILAFGANAFNMAFVMPFFGHAVFRLLRRLFKGPRGELLSLGIAAWAGLNLAALCTALMFGIQPAIAHDAAGLPLYCPYPVAVAVPAMMLPHLLVAGLVEAAFTVLVYAFVRRVSPASLAPQLPPTAAGSHQGSRDRWLTLVLGLMTLLSPLGLLAVGTAWGEWAPDELVGMAMGGSTLTAVPAGMAQGVSFEALFPDYVVSGLPEWLGYVLSALAGAALLVILFRLLAGLARPRKNQTA